MLYAKLCVNAIPAGIYTALCVTGLVLLLNLDLAAPHVWTGALFPIFMTSALVYVPLMALALPLLLLAVRFFAVRRLTMAWMHPKSMVWFGIAAAGIMTGVCHLNLRIYDDLIPPAAREALKLTAALMAFCWGGAVLCAAVAQSPKRSARWRAAAASLVVLPAIALVASAAGAAPPERVGPAAPAPADAAASSSGATERGLGGRPGRLLLVEIESATMDQLLPLVASGRLPICARLMKEGASARLNTIRFGPEGVDRAALLSGMPAWRQDLRPGAALRPRGRSGPLLQLAPQGTGFDPLAAVPSGERLRKPVPAALPSLCRALGVEAIWIDPLAEPGALRRDDLPHQPQLRRILETPPGPADPVGRYLEGIVADSLELDRAARARAMAAMASDGTGGTGLIGVRLPGLAAVSRSCLRYELPEEFGDVTADEAARFGPILGHYYEFLDSVLSDLIRAAGTDTYVVVASAHGVEPATLGERLGGRFWPGADSGSPTAAQDPAEPVAASGSWWKGPDGLLILHGSGIQPGMRLEDADLQDLVPTTLYLLGLPLGRDMRGRLLRKAFDPRHLEAHQVLFIPSYPPAS